MLQEQIIPSSHGLTHKDLVFVHFTHPTRVGGGVVPHIVIQGSLLVAAALPPCSSSVSNLQSPQQEKGTVRRSRTSSSTLWPKSDTSHFCPQLIGQKYHMAQPNRKEAGKRGDRQMEYLVSTLSLPQAPISPEATHQPGLALSQVDIDP